MVDDEYLKILCANGAYQSSKITKISSSLNCGVYFYSKESESVVKGSKVRVFPSQIGQSISDCIMPMKLSIRNLLFCFCIESQA